jgi:SAM-dependent methyltransferase
MKLFRGLPGRAGVIAAVAFTLAGAVCAQTATVDVPYVPTPMNVVDEMLRIADVKRDDFLIDLGCGDGRILITAARKYGTRGFGVDLDPSQVADARREAERAGVNDKVSFAAQNLFYTDISKATVVTLYLLPQINVQLRPLLFKQLKPGTRVVSHDFGMDEWQPDGRINVSVPGKSYGPPVSAVYFWIMPENAAGRWQWKQRAAGGLRDYEVTIDQTFQQIELKPVIAGGMAKVVSAKLRGHEISMTIVRDFGQEVHHEFTGRVQGDTIRGRVRISGDGPVRFEEWEAKRVQKGDIKFTAADTRVAARATSVQGAQ